jgi:quinol monooxygenase YgiN
MSGEAGAVILRILRGRAAHDDIPRLLGTIREDADAWGAAGPISYLPACRPDGDELEFLLVSTWPDAEAVLSLGGEVTRPRGRLGASGGLRQGRAQHYEMMMGVSREDRRPGEIVRLSSIALAPRRSSAFYNEVRRLWDELVGDAGLVALHVGRRVEPDAEQAVVVSVWEAEAALDAATSGGFVGGEDMASFYAGEPTIEHFTALSLEPERAGTAGR